jgi:4-amino-4-deoxy-L-arabinose transferase-like glycosyltransferase
LESLFQNSMIALIGAWAFNFSPSFYYYTINPLPDNFALCCSIWGLALFFAWYRKHSRTILFTSGLLLSIGALCKFPFILYFFVPITYFLIQYFKEGKEKQALSNGILATISILLPAAWYVFVIPGWFGNGIVNGMLNNKEPLYVIADYLQHNLFSTLPELLLNYGSVPFFLAGFYFLVKNKSYKSPLFPVLVALSLTILAYFFFEINMIATVHDYYLFPFYPALFILVGYGAYQLLSLKQRYVKYLVILVLLILPLTAFLRMQVRWNADSPGFNKDLLTYKNELREAVPRDALCIAGNDESHNIFFYYIDKKGWGFQDNLIDAFGMETMIDKGALYLYSDSREVDGNKEIAPYLDSLLLQRGTIRVYRLKTE